MPDEERQDKEATTKEATTEEAQEESAAPKEEEAETDLKRVARRLNAALRMIDSFEGMLAICDRMMAKVQQAVEVNNQVSSWPPAALLYSAASLAKPQVLAELERLTAEAARLGAEYQFLANKEKGDGEK